MTHDTRSPDSRTDAVAARSHADSARPEDAASAAAPFGTFFLPGPTEVRPEVLQAMTQPMIPHRGKGFEALFERIQAGLQLVFRTARPVFVSSSSATGLMEAAVRCAPPGPMLALVNGAFSGRFTVIARNTRREVDVLEVPDGETFDLDAVRARLAARRYAVTTVVHSETSTGVLTDVRAVQALAREHGTTCVTDSVTAVGGAPLEMDAWGLDFALTGSQKALALPPGLALGVATEAYMRTARTVEDRGLYFDLVEFEQYAAKHQTPNTPAIPLLYALEAQLAHIARETMEARWARHAAMARRTWDWVGTVAERLDAPAIRVLAREGERAPTVTAVRLPDGITGAQVVAAAKARGFVVGGGYGKLKDSTFRIGHMGDHTPDRLEHVLAACEDALRALLGR